MALVYGQGIWPGHMAGQSVARAYGCAMPACSGRVVGDSAAVISKGQLGSLLPGAASAVPLSIVGYPFDTVKTRLQVRGNLGMVQCMREMVAKEGFLSLYRGFSVSLWLLSGKMTLDLAAFELCSSRFSSSAIAPFAGGLFGSIISTSLLCPLMVVKIQMQAAGRGTHSSPCAAASAVWRASGVRGFYSGLPAALGVQVPFATLFFGTYGRLRDALPQTAWSPAFNGGVASIATWTVLQPLDTLRSRAMAAAHCKASPDVSMSRALPALGRSLIQESGVLSLWRGFGPVALRAFPSSGTSMLVYEWAKRKTMA